MKEPINQASRRAVTAIVIAAVAVAAFHALALAPRRVQTRNLEVQAASLAYQQAAQLQDTRELTDWLKEHVGAAPTLPPEPVSSASAVPTLLQKMADIGSKHGIQVVSVRPDAPEAPVTVNTGDGETRTYARIPVHLTARADYRALGAFLEELRAQGDLAVVRSVHLSLDVPHHAWNVDLLVDAFGRIS